MMRKRLFVLAMCAVLSLLLAGCSGGNTVSNAASKAGDAVSKAGEEVSEAVSRVESFLDGDDSSSGGSSSLGGGLTSDDDQQGSRLNGGDASDTGSSLMDTESGLDMDSGASSGLE